MALTRIIGVLVIVDVVPRFEEAFLLEDAEDEDVMILSRFGPEPAFEVELLGVERLREVDELVEGRAGDLEDELDALRKRILGVGGGGLVAAPAEVGLRLNRILVVECEEEGWSGAVGVEALVLSLSFSVGLPDMMGEFKYHGRMGQSDRRTVLNLVVHP